MRLDLWPVSFDHSSIDLQKSEFFFKLVKCIQKINSDYFLSIN